MTRFFIAAFGGISACVLLVDSKPDGMCASGKCSAAELHGLDEEEVFSRTALVQVAARMTERRQDCDSEIPVYNMAAWMEEHGQSGTLPDHPAIFRGGANSDEMKGFGKFTTFDHFLDQFGDKEVHVRPEYSQAGGVGSQFTVHTEERGTLREIAAGWNATHKSMGIFVCEESSLCKATMPNLPTPELFEGPHESINFLIGGPGSGLVLHEHGKTWQGLFSGRKEWYLIPPLTMTNELIESTYPFLLPPRAWVHKMKGVSLGQRPLRCVQHPGDIMYFPDKWYHGTLNLDAFQLAWGAKPTDRPQQTNSAAFTKIMDHFTTDGAVNQPEFPSCLDMRISEYKRGCAGEPAISASQLDAPLQRLRLKALASEGRNNSALTDTVTVALCWAADKVTGEAKTCSKSSELATKWRSMAAEVSPTRDCGKF